MRRREFMGRGLGGAALAAASGALSPAAAGAATRRVRFDPEDPVENVRVFARISADVDTSRQGRVHYSGKAFGVLEDGAVVPFYGIEGMGSLRAIRHGDGGAYRFLFNEFAVYTDLDTGAPLERWRNPVTGETVDVWHQRNGPVNYEIDPAKTDIAFFTLVGKSPDRAKGFRLPWAIDGSTASFRLDSISKRPNPLDPTVWKRESSGPTLQISEHSQYFLELADIGNPKLTSLPFRAALQSLKPWHPWMLMGQRPGKVYTAMTSRKVAGIQALPAAVAEYARSHLAAYLDAPESWTGAYTTAYSLYAKERQPVP
jgi:hypothetical protein